MVPGKWGLERSKERDLSDSMGWTSRVGQADFGEDHVSGLVERIARTMLEDDDEESQHANVWGGSTALPQSAAEVFASNWDKRRVEGINSISGLQQSVQTKLDSDAMELLYTELVRLKMEELAAAQQQLALYQNAFMDAGQSSHSRFSPIVGRASNMLASSALVKQHGSRSTVYNKQSYERSGGVDWSAPSVMQCQSNGRSPGQRLGAPSIYPSSRYLMGVPASRESGGTGVFLPRCRTGARNLRVHDSKRKHEFQYSVSAVRQGSFLPDRAKETVADRTSLQYPSCSPLQEVAPDISLPTEWTY